MGNYLSGGGGDSVITDADRALLSLKAQRKKLEDQMKLLERRADQSAAAARQLLGEGRRDRALVALRRKRLADNQYQSICAWLLRVEELLSGMESTRQQQAVVSALKDGAAALKAAQRALSVDEIERLNEETAEAKERMEGVGAALASADLLMADADEAAVEAELAELEAEALPSAPTTKVAVAADEEEELPSVPAIRVWEEEAEEEGEWARREEPALMAA